MNENRYPEPSLIPDHKKGSARAADLPPASEIAERLRNGEDVGAVAVQYGMTKSGLINRLRTSGWGARGEKTTDERNWAACGWCGRRAFGSGDVCRPCRSTEANARIQPTDADKLDGGQWVNRRGVMRWVPDPEPAPEDLAAALMRRWTDDDTLLFTEEQRRRGATEYANGSRTDFAIAARREYNRLCERKRRAAKRLESAGEAA